MTSSRFPIGVAQTASGTRLYPSNASNAIRPAPISPASGPSSAGTIRTRSRAGLSASWATTCLADVKKELASLSEAASEDHDLRIEDVDEGRDAGTEDAAHARQSLPRALVSLGGELHEVTCVGVLGEHGARDRVRRASGRERLEVAATRAAAPARRPVVLEHHVTELGSSTDRPTIRLPVEDQAAADARAQRQHDQVARP